MVTAPGSLVLQVGFFVDYVPEWLGPLLMASGIFYLIIGYFETSILQTELSASPVALVMMATGLMLLFVQSYLSLGPIVIVILLAFTRWIEGVAAVRFYQKVAYVLRHRDLPHTGTLTDRVALKLLMLFTVIMGGWAVLLVLTRGPFIRSLTYDLALVWTLVSATISILGMSLKFLSIRDQLPLISLFGFAVASTGAELFNFTSLFTELKVFAVSNISYSLGYWVAVYLWLRVSSEEITHDQSTYSRFRRAVRIPGMLFPAAHEMYSYRDDLSHSSLISLGLLALTGFLLLSGLYYFSLLTGRTVGVYSIVGIYALLISFGLILLVLDRNIDYPIDAEQSGKVAVGLIFVGLFTGALSIYRVLVIEFGAPRCRPPIGPRETTQMCLTVNDIERMAALAILVFIGVFLLMLFEDFGRAPEDFEPEEVPTEDD